MSAAAGSETRTTGAAAGEGGFSPKVVLALIAAGVFATSAFLLLTAYAPDLRATRGGGAHALSRSAIGYAAAVRLLHLIDEPVTLNQSALARTNYPGLMVLTPQSPGVLASLNTNRDRLIVLPKWAAEPDPAHPGWQASAQAMPDFFIVAALPKTLAGLKIERRKAGAGGPGRLISEFNTWPQDGLPAGPVSEFQTIAGGGLKPLVKDDQGRTVLGLTQGNLYVLSDPDLLNTQGISDPRTARIATTLLLTLKSENWPIAFDVSATEAGGQKSLLRLAIQPPFLASTLCLLVLAAQLHIAARHPRLAPRQPHHARAGLHQGGLAQGHRPWRAPRRAEAEPGLHADQGRHYQQAQGRGQERRLDRQAQQAPLAARPGGRDVEGDRLAVGLQDQQNGGGDAGGARVAQALSVEQIGVGQHIDIAARR